RFQEGVLGLLHPAEEIREVRDPRHVRLVKGELPARREFESHGGDLPPRRGKLKRFLPPQAPRRARLFYAILSKRPLQSPNRQTIARAATLARSGSDSMN